MRFGKVLDWENVHTKEMRLGRVLDWENVHSKVLNCTSQQLPRAEVQARVAVLGDAIIFLECIEKFNYIAYFL